MKIILLIARLLTGAVFIFSGFVKAVDPTGFAIKFEEYFEAFGMDFLSFSAMPLAIINSAAEVMIGLNLIFRVKMVFTAWLLLIFMVFYTILTFITALTNPVSDCGCFGDAVILTNWQTFWKNVILLIPALIVYIYRHRYNSISGPLSGLMPAAVNFAISVAISVYCLVHQPIFDFRPYSIGTNIPEKMMLPEGAPVDQYETLLIYEKNGVRQEFTENNFPWQDSTWKWVETKQKLISKGVEPPIHDFSITTVDGDDMTETILNESDYVMLIIAPKLENSSEKGIRRVNALADKAVSYGISVYCLTSSVTGSVDEFRNRFSPVYEICTTDETTLKTIVRANPGVLMLKEGTIIGKWNHRDIPHPDQLSSNVISQLLTRQQEKSQWQIVVILGLLVVVFYLIYQKFIH